MSSFAAATGSAYEHHVTCNKADMEQYPIKVIQTGLKM